MTILLLTVIRARAEEESSRKPRSLLTAIVDKIKNFHSKFHAKDPEETPSSNKDADGEENDSDDETFVDDETNCRVEFIVVETVQYSEVMTTECRVKNITKCQVKPIEECRDILKDVCKQVEREKCRERLEEECSTEYRTQRSQESVRECNKKCGYRWEESENGGKIWVVDRSSCKCEDVTRDTVAKIPFLSCSLVSRKECRNVPVEECRKVKESVCERKEKEECQEEPSKECKDIHKKVPNTIKRRKPIQVCSGKQEAQVIAA